MVKKASQRRMALLLRRKNRRGLRVPLGMISSDLRKRQSSLNDTYEPHRKRIKTSISTIESFTDEYHVDCPSDLVLVPNFSTTNRSVTPSTLPPTDYVVYFSSSQHHPMSPSSSLGSAGPQEMRDAVGSSRVMDYTSTERQGEEEDPL